MAMHWVPPPQGSLKINVHGTSSRENNDTGFAAVYRDSIGGLRHLTLGVIPDVSPLGNQLWAIFIAMKRAFLEGYLDVIVETNNLQAFRIIRNFSEGAPAGVYDLVSQIDIRIHDPRWFCKLAFVFPVRNMVERYGATMSMELCDRIYTLDRAVGGVEEMLDWDMGMGIDHPDYVDVVLPNNAPGPINFGEALALSDQLENLGIGLVAEPIAVVLEVEMDENPGGLDEVMEEVFHGGVAVADGILFAGDAPLEDID